MAKNSRIYILNSESGKARTKNMSDRQRAGLEVVDSVGIVMEALAGRLKLDSNAMSPQERMQLMQMALQCCQHREKSWCVSCTSHLLFAAPQQ